MSLLRDSPGLLEALRGEMTPKFLATRSSEGVPNVVPVVSLMPSETEEDTVFFGNFLLRKSIGNLEADRRVGILVITARLRGWILQGDFVEFQRTGPYVERQNDSTMLRYNAYTGVRNVGVIRVRAVEGVFSISRLRLAGEFLLARMTGLGAASTSNSGVKMPLPVQREFGRMVAVKALAWVADDGYPKAVPAVSLQPVGEDRLVFRRPGKNLPTPPDGVFVAANVLTLEAISYQVKGRCEGGRATRTIEVAEVYAGGPPYPGGRVA